MHRGKLILGLIAVSVVLTAAAHPVKVVLFPFREAAIVSRLDGTVKKCHFRVGEHFKTGDVIMAIDDARCQIEVRRTQAKAAESRVQLALAQSTYQAQKKLFEEKVQSRSELERREAEAASWAERVKIAAADCSEAQLMLSYCTLKAPFDGRLEELLCHEFETVRLGQPLFKIIDDRQLLAVMNVPLHRLKPIGTVLQFKFAPGNVAASGKIYEISPRADHRSGTIEIKALVDNSLHKLTAGMTGVLCDEVAGIAPEAR